VSLKYPIHDRGELFVPAIIASLLTPNQEDRRAAWVKSVQRPQRPTATLSSQFAHLRITRTGDFRAVWETKRWAKFNEMPSGVRDIVLLFFRDGVPPILEFIGELDFPGHTNSMPFTEYQARLQPSAAVSSRKPKSSGRRRHIGWGRRKQQKSTETGCESVRRPSADPSGPAQIPC